MPHVLVVDDNPRFGISVWRILSQAEEFGHLRDPAVGLLDGDDAGGDVPTRREAPDMSFALEWYDPTRRVALQKFTERCARLAQADVKVWALIDVRYPSVKQDSGLAQYSKYVEHFKQALPHGELWVMSSYRRPPESEAAALIRPKTIEDIRALRDAVKAHADTHSRPIASAVGEPAREPRSAATTSLAAATCLHVLVTGAGFEIPSDGYGVGVPPTRRLLLETDFPSGKIEKLAEDEHDVWLPLAKAAPFAAQVLGELEQVCAAGDLDRYWDLLLEGVQVLFLGLHAARTTDRAQREAWKKTFELEFVLRDAFRRSIAKYDMGHLRQYREAAELPWEVWLTTNYTRFIDRALEPDGPIQGKRWLLLKSVVEAHAYQHSHIVRLDPNASARVGIKLHGDIGQVYTMALTLRDKEAVSRFCIRPELHTMYGAGVTAIVEKLARAGLKTCWWHIVGHGLADMPLTTLIRRVIERTGAIQHRFSVVGPWTTDAPAGLRKCLHMESGGTPLRLGPCLAHQVTARTYIALLRRFGMSALESGTLDAALRTQLVAPFP
jgi:hypothetical protein